MSKKSSGVFYILIAAILWGFFPLFNRWLYAMGVDPLTTAAVRAFIAGTVFFAQALLGGYLKDFKLKDVPFYAAYGIISIAGTYCFYAFALSMLSSGEAVILLYTAPAFVVLVSRVLFKEPLTKKKLFALFLTFFGCFLVVKGYDFASFKLNFTGIAFGLMSGLCYASLTLFGRRGLKMYPAHVNATLPTIFAAMAFVLIRPPWTVVITGADMWLAFAGLAIIGSVLPYMFYLKGLEKGVEGGNASIIANVEPIVATLVGVAFFADILNVWQVIGISITLAGAALTAIKHDTEKK